MLYSIVTDAKVDKKENKNYYLFAICLHFFASSFFYIKIMVFSLDTHFYEKQTFLYFSSTLNN